MVGYLFASWKRDYNWMIETCVSHVADKRNSRLPIDGMFCQTNRMLVREGEAVWCGQGVTE